MPRLLLPLSGVVLLLAGCGTAGTDSLSGAIDSRPTGATSARAAVTTFLRELERHDGVGIRQVMTPLAQQNESIEGGLLSSAPTLWTYRIRSAEHEDPRNNASPRGSIASVRYTVALTPADGFDDDDTDASAYDVLVSETRSGRWLVAELGGGG